MGEADKEEQAPLMMYIKCVQNGKTNDVSLEPVENLKQNNWIHYGKNGSGYVCIIFPK